ncbi:IS630 family transposase, partial [Desulfatiferula olefinivorans]
RGETPAIKFHPRCKRVNLISTATNQGKVRFMVYKDKMNSQALIKFMTRLIKDSDKKIYLILDNLKVHHNHMVKDWVNEHEDESELFFLPSYSPELNPDEYLNCDLKVGVHSQAPSRTADELKCNSISHLKKLQKLPDALKITSNTRGLLKQLVVAVFNWRFNIIAEGGFNHNCSVDTANDSGRCHPNFMQGLFDL